MRFASLLLIALVIQINAIPLFAQNALVQISGQVKSKADKSALSLVNVLLRYAKDSSFTAGTITNDEGRFILPNIKQGKYVLEYSLTGYISVKVPVFVGSLSPFLQLPLVEIMVDTATLATVTVTGKRELIQISPDKRTFQLDKNLTQSGCSVLQALQNVPGVTMQEGKLLLRGSDKIAVLIDGKQTALTGFGNQTSLDNIPASAIEKIEIINNPSAKYDANGNAGIINIVFKKNKQEGFNGKAGFTTGLGAIWQKKGNLPGIRPQFQATPKLNPSLSINYRKNKWNSFVQGDVFYNPTLNKNEFTTRTYNNGQIIDQQTKRNRTTTVYTGRAGVDWAIDANNSWSLSGLFSSEKILDNGDEPFYYGQILHPDRLWQFLEDELKTTVTAATSFRHAFKAPGQFINAGINYTFHREDEKYFFTNFMPTFTGLDAFKLLSNEHVTDFTVDYVQPLRYGRFEAGLKYRYRNIPTNMAFYPGINSPLDVNAGGWAVYRENIPAVYGTYLLENSHYELEAGLRMEYVNVRYSVDPNHNTYKSDGYQYTQPFPNFRFGWKINQNQKLSLYFNRRVDRPNELDIRVFPKYDDAEIVKVGNPALQPQFTTSLEMGFKSNIHKGFLYAAIYHRMSDGTITRIATTVPPATIIYSIMQNAGKSANTGVEVIWSQEVSKSFSFNCSANGYRNKINAFSVYNLYPSPNTFSAAAAAIFSGNVKCTGQWHLHHQWDAQLSAVYLAKDLIPQGTINSRFSLDVGLKKQVQNGKGEWFANATDLLNTMVIKKSITGQEVHLISSDYLETQVIRIGYNYKF